MTATTLAWHLLDFPSYPGTIPRRTNWTRDKLIAWIVISAEASSYLQVLWQRCPHPRPRPQHVQVRSSRLKMLNVTKWPLSLEVARILWQKLWGRIFTFFSWLLGRFLVFTNQVETLNVRDWEGFDKYLVELSWVEGWGDFITIVSFCNTLSATWVGNVAVTKFLFWIHLWSLFSSYSLNYIWEMKIKKN